jgi:sugar-specific transcriptional regulator TrmB
VVNLSVERIKRALVNLGLSETDAEIYIYLYTNGSKKARNIVCNLELRKGQAYRSLKRLQLQGIATSNGEFPSVFSAVSFKLVLDSLLDAKKDQINSLKAIKEALLSTWRSITEKDDVNS